MTLERLRPELVDVVPELKRYIPPAKVFDKMTYSPWVDGNLHRNLQGQGADETHNASLSLLGDRVSVQVELSRQKHFFGATVDRLKIRKKR